MCEFLELLQHVCFSTLEKIVIFDAAGCLNAPTLEGLENLFRVCNALFPLDIDGDYLYSHPNLKEFRVEYGYESYNIRRTPMGAVERYFCAGGQYHPLYKVSVQAKDILRGEIPKALSASRR